MTRVAIVQQPPIFLDKSATIETAVSFIKQASAQGAELVVFTETFISGYPTWLWRLRPGADWNLSESLYAKLWHSAVDMSSSDLDPLYEAAKSHSMTIVCGIEERDDKLSQATVYNAVVCIGPDGKLLNKHRKLMPTNPERMVWGFGDGTGLKVIDSPIGRIGALICWENYMPLARYALYAQSVELYIAPTYDSGDGWIGSLQHIAREGRCYVIGCGNIMQGGDFPDDLPEKDSLYPDPKEWVNPGDSVVIAPGGEIIAGPMRKEKGLLMCDIELEKVALSKRALDVVGHYSRPDIFTLHVDDTKKVPIDFRSEE